MKKRAGFGFGAAVLLVLLVSGLVACAPNPLDAAPVDTDHVTMIKSYRFAPVVIRVKPGTTVTWTNDDNFTHSVQLQESGAQPVVASPGQTIQLTFDQPGTYLYICSFHPQDMKGKIIVTNDTGANVSSYGDGY